VVIGLAVIASLATPAKSATKLAVCGTLDKRDPTAGLIVGLSRVTEDYVVIEREQLEQAVAEPGLQAQGLSLEKGMQAGRLLGADGVLWVEAGKFQGRPVVITRLCATKSGVVVGWPFAAASNDVPTLDYFLALGLDPAKENAHGDNALDVALRSNANHTAAKLRELGVKTRVERGLSPREE